MTRVLGSELQVGDTIEVWWQPHRDTITELRRYDGPLAYLFPKGAKIATFALLKGGMTIENDEYFELIASAQPHIADKWRRKKA